MKYVNKILFKLKKILFLIMSRFVRLNEFESQLLRKLFNDLYNIEVGLYSYGCFDPRRIGRYTKVGRYCSFSGTAYRFNGNHAKDFLMLHPYVYNIKFGLVCNEMINRKKCTIEDDVWIGHNAIILPGVESIGRGSIIGAGTVVTKNVPRYAIVVGNPARVSGYRFNEDLIEKIEATRWWEMDKQELASMIKKNPDAIYHPDIPGVLERLSL